MIDQGVGKVGLSGTREVCPKENTTYTITVANAGGSAKAVAEVPVLHTTTLHINFDTNKADIRKTLNLLNAKDLADRIDLDKVRKANAERSGLVVDVSKR